VALQKLLAVEKLDSALQLIGLHRSKQKLRAP
jgi:hypothetical protein